MQGYVTPVTSNRFRKIVNKYEEADEIEVKSEALLQKDESVPELQAALVARPRVCSFGIFAKSVAVGAVASVIVLGAMTW
jgi:TATA-binding protein-associated factor Taf7